MSAEEQARPDAYYKVERLLREKFPDAAKPQPSGVSVDVRLYFREKPEGDLWCGLAFLDEDGHMMDFGEFRALPLKDPPSLPWLLEVLCELGFEAAPRRRTKPRGSS